MYQLKEILPHVYHVRFESRYQLAMHFLRAQEYYESPKYRGKLFTLVDFMEWYSGEYGEGAFTYPLDWSGFNCPDWVLAAIYEDELEDENKYDRRMRELYFGIPEANADATFYLIGTSG